MTPPLCQPASPASSLVTAGKVKLNTVPPPGLGRGAMEPPCASTMVREIERPTPIPWRFVVTNGWKSCAVISGEIPAPVSETLISTMLSGTRRGRDDKFALVRVFHGFNGVAHQIEQDLLNLHLVGKHEIGARVELEAHTHAFVLDADQRQRTCFLDELLHVLHPPLAFAAGDEIAQPADNLPARSACSAALSMASRRIADVFVGTVFQQPARSLHVVGDRRERLVELVRQRGRHLAHGGQSRDMNELGLQFLQPRLGLLALGEIADEAGEEALLAAFSSRRR